MKHLPLFVIIIRYASRVIIHYISANLSQCKSINWRMCTGNCFSTVNCHRYFTNGNGNNTRDKKEKGIQYQYKPNIKIDLIDLNKNCKGKFSNRWQANFYSLYWSTLDPHNQAQKDRRQELTKIVQGVPQKKSALGMQYSSHFEVFEQSIYGYVGVLNTSRP